jgi:putative ABC transport system substrate-binding protein
MKNKRYALLKNIFSLFGVILISSLILNACQNNKVPRVGILQDKPQEWADALKLGFVDGLIDNGMEIGRDVVIIPRSASGDPQAFSAIAETFAHGDYDIIYSLGTQASQEIFNLTKSKPIIFGAVTDPIKAGFFNKTLSNPLANITGSQDLWPYSAQFDLIKEILPNVKKIGIVYSSSEINSAISVSYIKDECRKRGITIDERTITSESEVQIAVSAILSNNIDLFFIPADNTAQTSSPAIISMCNKKGIPVFTGIPGIVENGGIATVGTNYYELGKLNANQVVQIIKNHKKASEIPVSIANSGDIYLNLTAAKKLNIVFSKNIIDKAYKIY